MKDKKGDGKNRAWTAVGAILLIIGLGLIVRYNLAVKEKGVRAEPTLSELRDAFPAEIDAVKMDSPIPHYLGTADGKEAAVVMTAELDPAVKGYVDQISSMVVIDSEGNIKSVTVIDHRETPEYMQRVIGDGFLARLKNANVKDGFDKIDTVTGASITSQAIRDDVAAAAALAGSRLFGLKVAAPETPSWRRSLTRPKVLAVLVALALALYARFGRWPKKYKKEAAWTASILLIGLFAMTPYTLLHSFQLLSGNFPGPGAAVAAVLCVFVVGTTIIWGPVWCGYACPFGALQELLSRLGFRRWKVSPSLFLAARKLRFAVLFISVVGFFGLGLSSFAEIEPFGHLFGRTTSKVAWAFILVVLLSSLFVKRFWCRFLCPTGACLVLLSAHGKYIKSVGEGLDRSGIDNPDEEESEKEISEEEDDKEKEKNQSSREDDNG